MSPPLGSNFYVTIPSKDAIYPQLGEVGHIVDSRIKSVLTNYMHGHNFYPARMREGKVIVRLSVCLSVVTTKIARSRNLGLRATRKRNQSVEISERLA